MNLQMKALNPTLQTLNSKHNESTAVPGTLQDMVLLSGELIDEGIASFQCLGFFWFHIFEKAPERSGSLGDHQF